MPDLSSENTAYVDLKDSIPGLNQCLTAQFLTELVCNQNLLRDCIIEQQQNTFNPNGEVEFQGCAALQSGTTGTAESLALFNADTDAANCQLTFPSGLITVTANLGPDLNFVAGFLVEVKCGGQVVGSTTVFVPYDSIGGQGNTTYTGTAPINMPMITAPVAGKTPAPVTYCMTLTSGGNGITAVSSELCGEARCSLA